MEQVVVVLAVWDGAAGLVEQLGVGQLGQRDSALLFELLGRVVVVELRLVQRDGGRRGGAADGLLLDEDEVVVLLRVVARIRKAVEAECRLREGARRGSSEKCVSMRLPWRRADWRASISPMTGSASLSRNMPWGMPGETPEATPMACGAASRVRVRLRLTCACCDISGNRGCVRERWRAAAGAVCGAVLTLCRMLCLARCLTLCLTLRLALGLTLCLAPFLVLALVFAVALLL